MQRPYIDTGFPMLDYLGALVNHDSARQPELLVGKHTEGFELPLA
jgi:hypothetical protein